jgi:hypothetical protein
MNDVSGRPPRAAVSPPRGRLPKLSQPFLTEDDAARWVHGQIPGTSGLEHGSVILRLPQGGFVATRPQPGEVQRFDLRTLLDVDAQGNYVHPPGYTCVANVHSHPPAHDIIRQANPGQDEATLRLFLNFFSDIDFVSDVSERAFFASAYLSGPDGVLLKYSPSGSKDELSYYNWLRAGAPRGNPIAVYGVENIIRKVAALGELKVIVSNADWGESVGRVPADWQPRKAFGGNAVRELPPLTRLCASAERAVLAALKTTGAQTSGLILKHRSRNDYVATCARPAGLAAWRPESLFPSAADGQVQLPPDYALEGFYYASRPDPALFPPSQAWLYENFFTPAEMALAVGCHARSKHLGVAGRPLSLYMQARDFALLKYRFSDSEGERGLSRVNPDGSFADGGLQAGIQAGTLTPRQFVALLARVGQLSVLRGSVLWGRIGEVGPSWVPYANFDWPPLSPVFLSADDAARYVHARIDSRRERRYAGYIFQRNDGRFVASEPREGGIEQLVQGDFYPRDNAGRAVFPDGHGAQARYVAHQALSILDPVAMQRLHRNREEALLSLQMPNVEEVRQVLLDEITLYVSGVQRSLLRFDARETHIAQVLAQSLGTARHPGPMAVALESGSLLPSAFIREQAAGGYLSIVNNHERWGPRGQVSALWSPLSAPWPWRRPAQVAFGAVFATADAAAEDQYERDTRLHDQERAWFGFILKHNVREEYVASELVPVSEARNDVFQPQSLFGATSMPPWYGYPEGFNRHAFIYSRQRVKRPAEGSASWLARYFIPPLDLFNAVFYSRRRQVRESSAPIPVYLSTQDGALLKFDNRKGNKLFDNATPRMGLEDFTSGLSSGMLQPADFVRIVASHGGLRVMRTSACWDRPWPVDADWRPFLNLPRRWLSPAFIAQDDAVAYVRSRLPTDASKLVGGVVLKRRDGLFLATDPVEVPQEDFDPQWIFPDESFQAGQYPEGCLVVARYRTRRVTALPLVLSEIQRQTYLNMLSVDTLYSALQRPREYTSISEYLFAPDGALVRYDVGFLSRLRADLANVLTDFKSLPSDLDAAKIKQQIYSGALTPGVWIDTLAQSGYLQVVSGSRLWGKRGTVTRWMPYPVLPTVADAQHKALAPAVCSPVFIHPDATALSIHDGPRSPSDMTFGYLLWNARSGLFIASLPVAIEGTKMAVEQVFADAVVPAGYAVHGLYLRAASMPQDAADEDPRRFCPSPLAINQLCAAAETAQGYRPIYLSCADGALLRFAMDAFEPGEFHDRFGQIELRRNLFASQERAQVDEFEYQRRRIDLQSYVLRMARAGKLEVIVTSAYWSRRGVVDVAWQPRMVEMSVQMPADPLPGPLFEHADDAARYAQQRAGSGYVLDTGFVSAILARTASLLNSTYGFVPLEPLAYSALGENPLPRILRHVGDAATGSGKLPRDFILVATHQMYLSGNNLLVVDTDQVYANFAAPGQMYAQTHALVSQGFKVKDYYYSTPHGVLIRYSPTYTQAEQALLRTRPAQFIDGKWQAGLAPSDFISRLIDLGDFRVLIAGHYWLQAGRMGTRWRERRRQAIATGIVRNREEL